MKGIIKDTVILFVITLAAGFLLGGVYHVTKEPIAKQEKIKKDNANKAVFEDARTFSEYEGMESEKLVGEAYKGKVTVDEVLVAKNDTEDLGYVITVTSNEGYGGNITLAVGIRNDGTVNGISFLSISETAGLGMNATKEKFYGQFAGKDIGERDFEYTKNGAEYVWEIDAISSATITTNAVTTAVNAALDAYRTIDAAKTGGASNE